MAVTTTHSAATPVVLVAARFVSRLFVALPPMIPVACGGSTAPAAITDDAVVHDDDARTESGAFDAGPACTAISGTAPFGVRMRGLITFDEPSVRSFDAEAFLLFPKGRVAGAPVIIGTSNRPGVGNVITESVLDSSLGAPASKLVAACGGTMTATLVGPMDGLVTDILADFSTTDVRVIHEGHAKLCGDGAVVERASLAVPAFIFPAHAVTITTDFPLDVAASAGARVLVDGVEVPVTTTVSASFLNLTPVRGFSLAAKEIAFDLSRVTDALGRPVTAPPPTTMIAPPAGFVTDRTFDALPPADAMYGLAATLEAGAVYLRLEERVGMLGLGIAGGAKTLRLRHRFECAPGEVAASRTVVVSADGAVQPLTVGCHASLVEETVPLPGPGPYDLLLERFAYTPLPCSFPPHEATVGAYVLDEIELKP